MPKFERVELKETITHEVLEHEVFLSFLDDAGAAAFYQWWEEQGAEKFALWCLDNPDFKDLMH